jgi:hypothetical protein
MDNLKWILSILGVVAVVGLVMWLILKPGPTPPPLTGGFTPATVTDPVKPERGMEEYKGKVIVTIRDTIPPSLTPTVREYKAEVLIPKDKAPVMVRTKPDSALSTATYTAFKDPTASVKWGVLVGGSISGTGQPSPFLGVTALTAFNAINFGLAGSRAGIGPFLGIECWREWNVVMGWNAVRFKDSGGKTSWVSPGIAYRF